MQVPRRSSTLTPESSARSSRRASCPSRLHPSLEAGGGQDGVSINADNHERTLDHSTDANRRLEVTAVLGAVESVRGRSDEVLGWPVTVDPTYSLPRYWLAA